MHDTLGHHFAVRIQIDYNLTDLLWLLNDGLITIWALRAFLLSIYLSIIILSFLFENQNFVNAFIYVIQQTSLMETMIASTGYYFFLVLEINFTNGTFIILLVPYLCGISSLSQIELFESKVHVDRIAELHLIQLKFF